MARYVHGEKSVPSDYGEDNGSSDTENWGIFDFLRQFLYKIGEIATNIKNIFTNITSLFEAPDTSADEDDLKNNLNSANRKFGFNTDVTDSAYTIKDVISQTNSTQKVYMNLSNKYWSGNVTVIDLSWYAPYKQTGDDIICAFAYFIFAWKIFTRLPNLIKGNSASSDE